MSGLDQQSDVRVAWTFTESERYLDKIINSVADPIFVKDSLHRWVTLNEACCKLIGHPREVLIGESDYSFFPTYQADVFWQNDEDVLQTGEENVSEEEFTDASGDLHTIVTKKTRYIDSAGQRYIVGVIRDVTVDKVAEKAMLKLNEDLEQRVRERTAELEALNAQLTAAKEDAEQANHLKNRFLANMSHELRTPLNAIIGYSEMLSMGHDIQPDKRERYLRNISASGHHLLTIINDLLDIAKIESDKLEVDIAPLELIPLVNNVVAMVRPLAMLKNVSIEITIAPELKTIAADAPRLRQILVNLLNNAIKFNRRDGQVILRFDCIEGSRLQCCVHDTGIGIPPEHLEKLFTEFYQVDSENTRQHEGIGLGLALTRRLVALHGGEISVESQQNEGSTFKFNWPLHALTPS